MKATLDYHGFVRRVTLKRLTQTVVAAFQFSLSGHGVRPGDLLTFEEEPCRFYSSRFRLVDRARALYRCSGCDLCDPRRRLSLLRQLADLAARAAVREIMGRRRWQRRQRAGQ